jgi:hypothetical protein
MTWLNGLLAWLGSTWFGKLILNYAWGKVTDIITRAYNVYKKQRDIDAKAKASAQKVKDAKTEDELEEAAKDILGRK